MFNVIKKFLLVIPMLICLFGLQNVNSEQVMAQTVNVANLRSTNISIEEPTMKDGVENNRWTDFDVDCEEIQTLFIPPIFGFCGISIAFGSGCGEDSNYSCVSALQFCGGSLTIHTECALQ